MTISKYYILPVLTLGLLLTTLLINEYRFEIFGITPGYAPNNFGFNIFFFLPSTLVLLICSIIVLIRSPDNKNQKAKLFSILIISPILILWAWQIIRMLIIFNY